MIIEALLRSTLLSFLVEEATAYFTMLDRLNETAPAYVLGLFFFYPFCNNRFRYSSRKNIYRV